MLAMDMCRNLPFLLCLTMLSVHVCGALKEPEDAEQTSVTVIKGSTAVLPCAITNLGNFKVVWADEWGTLLTLDDRRIINDVERPYTKDWNLHIRRVKYSDRGRYTCQINTNPVMTKVVFLGVVEKHVPVEIIERLTSGDQLLEVGDYLKLVCAMTGVPEPVIEWYRLNSEEQREALQSSGGEFRNPEVSRFDSGVYECIGKNGVSPTVSWKVTVAIYFRPKVSSRISRISQRRGWETILECKISANPYQTSGWVKSGSNMTITESYKFQLDLYWEGSSQVLSLKIRNLEPTDYGEYVCYAENPYGYDAVSVVLAELGVTYTPTTSRGKVTSSNPIDDVSTTSKATGTSPRPTETTENVKQVRLEYYREQILTARKWRQMMDTEKNFFEAVIKFIEQKKEGNTQQ